MDQVTKPKGFYANISPDAFHRSAKHYYKCKQDFRSPDPGSHSPVPYFLLCRAIELELKSRHLRQMDQMQVKREFSHDIVKAYEALPELKEKLNQDESDTLKAANAIYKDGVKGFEYFRPEDALQGYSNFPNLDVLDAIAAKLIGSD